MSYIIEGGEGHIPKKVLKLCMHHNHLEGLLKHTWLGLTPRVWDSLHLRQRGENLHFPGDTAADGSRHFKNDCFSVICI